MIRVTIELLPGGHEDGKRTIGLVEIANLKSHANNTADYGVLLTKTPPFKGALRAAWRKATVSCEDGAVNRILTGEDDELIAAIVNGHHRQRRGVYDLLFRALAACGLDARVTK